MASSRPTVLFFGSFLEYSTSALQELLKSEAMTIIGVITTPPQPAGRKQELKPTHTHRYAETQALPVFTPEKLTPESLHVILAELGETPDLFITAGYGKLLPASWLQCPKIAALNIHFSLLPNFRGANPAEWAILLNHPRTGVSLIEMSPEFDTGHLVATQEHPLIAQDTRLSVYQALYPLGALLCSQVLPAYVAWKRTTSVQQIEPQVGQVVYLPPLPQPLPTTPYARRFYREDGFISWEALSNTMAGRQLDWAEITNEAEHELISPTLVEILGYNHENLTAEFVARAHRALIDFPGLWTIVNTLKGEKRMKILSCQVHQHKLELVTVQVEGKSPTSWQYLKSQIKPPAT